MFEQTFVLTEKTKRGRTVVAPLLLQLLIVGMVVVIPMWNYEKLSAAMIFDKVQLASPPPGPPPAVPKVEVYREKKPTRLIRRRFDDTGLQLPKVIPNKVAKIEEEEAPPPVVQGNGPYVVGGIPNGNTNGKGNLIRDIVALVPNASPPPPIIPPTKKEETSAPTRIRVGGNVQQAMLVSQPRPSYPPLARQVHVSGTVTLNATIGKDGHILNLSVVKGHPLLIQAAMDAVKNWVYKPTLLNGEPVEVTTTIDVTFTLSQ